MKDYKAIFTNFYLKYNPAKVDEIDYLLSKYKGDEELLIERICKKYNILISDFYRDQILRETDGSANESITNSASEYESRYNFYFPKKKTFFKSRYFIVMVVFAIIGMVVAFLLLHSKSDNITGSSLPNGKIVQQEKIIDYYIPDSPINTIKLSGKAGKDITPMPFTVQDQVFIKLNPTNIFIAEFKQMNQVLTSETKRLLTYNDIEISESKDLKTNIITGKGEIKIFDSNNVILRLPQNQDSTVEWVYSLDSEEEVKCIAKFSSILINNQSERALFVTEKEISMSNKLFSINQCLGVNKYIYRKHKGLWYYAVFACDGRTIVFECKFSKRYHDSEFEKKIYEFDY
ncbi:MAG TPA: hypothetical protein VIH86_05085 [Puia sp.]